MWTLRNMFKIRWQKDNTSYWVIEQQYRLTLINLSHCEACVSNWGRSMTDGCFYRSDERACQSEGLLIGVCIRLGGGLSK